VVNIVETLQVSFEPELEDVAILYGSGLRNADKI